MNHWVEIVDRIQKKAVTQRGVAERLGWLDRYDFEYLRELYDEDCPAALAPFEEAVDEFRRFAALFVTQDDALAVTNRSVDRLWHVLMIHTEDYAAFCARFAGERIEHRPHSERRPVPTSAIANTFAAYQARYGRIPDSWIPSDKLSRAQIAGGCIPAHLEMRWSGWPGRR